MGKLQHFDIIYNNPQEVYNVGDHVNGTVRITLNEPMKMRCVKLEIFGQGRVHWTTTHRRSSGTTFTHYRSEEIYFSSLLILYGSDPKTSDSSMHPTGAHQYAFNFQLPQNIPSSFEGELGYVRYWCKAIIDKPWKFNHEAKNPFSVVRHVDLNRYSPQLREPVEDQGEGDASCCCISGMVNAKFKINKTGFVPGETIFVSGSIKNDSNAPVIDVGAKLVQRINFYGVSDSLFSSGEVKCKEVEREVARFTKGQIAKNQSMEFENERLVIPPIPPSELPNCQCIDSKYEVICFAEPDWGLTAEVKADVVIGTIPLQPIVTNQPPAYGNMAPTALPVPLKDGSMPMAGFAPVGSGFALPGTAPPPPSYESCVFGAVGVKDDADSKYVQGRLDYAPLYTYYNWNQAPAGGAPMASAPPAAT